MKFHVNTHRLAESDFWFDVIISRRRPWRHFTLESVLPSSEWKRSVCRAGDAAAPVSSWSIVHLYLFVSRGYTGRDRLPSTYISVLILAMNAGGMWCGMHWRLAFLQFVLWLGLKRVCPSVMFVVWLPSMVLCCVLDNETAKYTYLIGFLANRTATQDDRLLA